MIPPRRKLARQSRIHALKKTGNVRIFNPITVIQEFTRKNSRIQRVHTGHGKNKMAQVSSEPVKEPERRLHTAQSYPSFSLAAKQIWYLSMLYYRKDVFQILSEDGKNRIILFDMLKCWIFLKNCRKRQEKTGVPCRKPVSGKIRSVFICRHDPICQQDSGSVTRILQDLCLQARHF